MTAPGSPRAREAIRSLTLALAAIAFACALVEVGARVAGLQPYRPVQWSIRVEPGGRYQVAHPTLGYAPRPGRFTIHFGDGHTWRATHLADSTRITRPLAAYPGAAGRPETAT